MRPGRAGIWQLGCVDSSKQVLGVLDNVISSAHALADSCRSGAFVTDWIRVAALSEVERGSALEVVAGGEVVALFNVEGQVYALDGICPHQGGPLGKGQLCGHTITCPWHGWQFDVTSGQHLVNASICHRRFEVKIEGEQVFVRAVSEA